MEFFNAEFLQHGITHEGSQISVWDRERIGKLGSADEQLLSQIVAELGVRSGRAQALSAPITTLQRVLQRGQFLLIHCFRNGASTKVQGFIKTGILNLFLADEKGTYDAVNASCVLDFYVCESCQRQGVGKALFEFVLSQLSILPEFLAYDRPSSKLVAFLAKHYALVHGITQPNNFVIFRGFFQGNKRANHKEHRQPCLEHASMSVASSAHTIRSATAAPAHTHSYHTVVPPVQCRDNTPQVYPQRNLQVDRYSTAQGGADCPSMPNSRCSDNSRGHVRRAELDHWMLPQSSGIQRSLLPNHAHANTGNSSCTLRSLLPSVNSSSSHCKGMQDHVQGYKSVNIWDQAGRAQQRAVDPDLTAALKPDTAGPAALGMNSNVFSQGNYICGLLFDQQKVANRSGLQYTLGGADCSLGGTAAAWDPSGRDKASHRRFHRPRR